MNKSKKERKKAKGQVKDRLNQEMERHAQLLGMGIELNLTILIQITF